MIKKKKIKRDIYAAGVLHKYTIGLVTSVNDAEQGRVRIPTGGQQTMEAKVNLISVSPGGVLENRSDDNVIHLFFYAD